MGAWCTLELKKRGGDGTGREGSHENTRDGDKKSTRRACVDKKQPGGVRGSGSAPNFVAVVVLLHALPSTSVYYQLLCCNKIRYTFHFTAAGGAKNRYQAQVSTDFLLSASSLSLTASASRLSCNIKKHGTASSTHTHRTRISYSTM